MGGELQWQVHGPEAPWLCAQGVKVGEIRDDFRDRRGRQEVDCAGKDQRPRLAVRLQLEGWAARHAGPCGLGANKVRRRRGLEEAVSASESKVMAMQETHRRVGSAVLVACHRKQLRRTSQIE